MSRRYLGVLVVLGVVLSAVAAPAAGSSPPRAVCGVCDDGFAVVVEDHTGVDPEFGESVLRIDVRADGSARFEARVAVTGGAEALRGDPRLREAVVAAYDSGSTLVDDPRDLSVGFEGRTLVVTFRVPDVAHRSVGGVVLFDLFGADPGPGYRLDADRLVVAGPEGTRVVNDPPEGEVSPDGNHRTAVWSGDAPDTGTYVAFGEGGPASWAAGQLAVAAAVAPLMASHAAVAGWPHLLGVAVAVGLAVGAGRLARGRDRERVPTAGLGAAVAGLGVLLAVLGVVAGGVFSGTRQGVVTVALGVVAAVLGVGAALRDRGVVVLGRRWPAVVAGDRPRSVAASALVTAVAVALLAGPRLSPRVAAGALLACPLGYVAARPGRWGALGVATLAYAVPTLGYVLSVVPVGGFGPVFLALLVGVGTVVTLVAGLPFLALGAVLGAEGAAGEDDGPTDGGSHDPPDGPVIR